MFDSNHKDYDEYHACLNAICAINEKYGFRSTDRSVEDKEAFRELTERMEQIREQYDRDFPVEPCVGCGEKRTSFWGDKARCMSIGRCRWAPVAVGC